MQVVLIFVSMAPSWQCATDALPAIWDHTVLTATRYRRTHPCLICIWEESQTSAYYCRNLPSSEAGTSLYCLVNRGTCVCEQLAQGCYLGVPQLGVEPAISGLQVW